MADTEDTIARNGTGAGAIATADPLDAEIMEAPAPQAPAGSEAPEAIATATDAAPEAPAAATEAGAPDVTPAFLSELSVAMLGVVERERARVGAIVDADATAHHAQARKRAAEESAAFQQVADEDVASIEAWADAEVARIRDDAARRIENRRADLEASLSQHDVVLQGELDGIDSAVAAYGTTLDAFLEDLRVKGDPADIASRAGSLPRPPDLGEVRALARTAALTRIAEAAMAADMPAESDAEPDAATDAPTDAAEEPSAPTATVGLIGDSDVLIGDSDDAPVAFDPSSIGLIGDTEDPSAPTEPTPVADATATMVGVFGQDEASASDPVPVMDPAATEPTGWEPTPVLVATEATGWETSTVPSASGSSADEAASGSPGHPNAAVRLIRSVAPWTAPTHREADATDDRGPDHT